MSENPTQTQRQTFPPRLFALWARVARRCAVVVLLAAISLSGFCLYYTGRHLGMNTDTLEMLSAELPWRRLDNRYKQEFPQYRDDMVAVIEAATPDQAADAARALYRELSTRDKHWSEVFHAGSLDLFAESALLYLDEDELQDLADRLALIQPFLATLARDPTLAGLFTMLSEAIAALDDGEEFDLRPLLREINRALAASATDADHRMSWQLLMNPDEARPDASSRATRREFILLKPKLDYSILTPAAAPLAAIRRLLRQTDLENEYGVRVRMTGAAALQHEELAAVTRGTVLAAALALIMVTGVMLAGLRSARLMLCALFSLFTGLSATAAFAAWTVGALNLISVAFTVLYIGLGVDFAIHFCLRYREHLLAGADNDQALERAASHIGGALFLCALSTAVGFFAFMPTDYRGVAELGWIAGFGMLFSFLITLTLLPALLRLFPLRTKAAARARKDNARPPSLPSRLSRSLSRLPLLLSRAPHRYCKTVTAAAFLLFILALMPAADLRFDPNPLNLHAPDGEAVRAYRDLLADKSVSPWTAIALAADEQQAQALVAALARLPTVDKSVYLGDFIPPRQEAKLDVIDELALLLGELHAPETAAAATRFNEAATRTALAALRERLAQSRSSSRPGAAAAEWTRLQTQLARLAQENSAGLRQAQIALLRALPGRLAALDAALRAAPITRDSLPEELRRRWRSDNGYYRVEVFPARDLQDQAALREFVAALRSVGRGAGAHSDGATPLDDAAIFNDAPLFQDAPQFTGAPLIHLGAGEAVAAAFAQAFASALLVIALLLLLLRRKKTDAVYVLAPLSMALVFTAAAAAMLEMPLNFANIIALPLILGIGVDSGIHIVHRFRADAPADGNILRSSSARAVVVSSFTTMAGIGNLAVSPHAGTASMGALLTIGVLLTLFCMVIVLPALLSWRGGGQTRGGEKHRA